MNKLKLVMIIAASIILTVSASAVWEGTALVQKEPGAPGLYAATNSFPVNTIVDVINLENGETVQIKVSAHLDNSSLLALISKDAASIIDLQFDSPGRIRMKESANQFGFSKYCEERGFYGQTAYDTDALINIDGYDLADMIKIENEELIDVPDNSKNLAMPDYDELTLAPTESRPPVASTELNPNDFIRQAPLNYSVEPTKYTFSAPMINTFERGKYYVQIGAYSIPNSTESELRKIENNLPKAVMNIGSNEKPLFRVLIGPLSLGDSGDVLQRYKRIYSDAFIWLGR
jgi:hypothetical protein